MVNYNMKAKKTEKHSFSKLKSVLKQRKKIDHSEENIQKEDNSLFYCSLCSKFMDYSELIDGSKCCFCYNDLFIILWNEYKKEMTRNISKKTKVCRGYLS